MIECARFINKNEILKGHILLARIHLFISFVRENESGFEMFTSFVLCWAVKPTEQWSWDQASDGLGWRIKTTTTIVNIVLLVGWNSWNHFQCGINEKLIQQTADLIVSTGLAAFGYEYGLPVFLYWPFRLFLHDSEFGWLLAEKSRCRRNYSSWSTWLSKWHPKSCWLHSFEEPQIRSLFRYSSRSSRKAWC